MTRTLIAAGLAVSIALVALASPARAAWIRAIADGDTEMVWTQALSANGRVVAGECRDGDRYFTCVWSLDHGFDEIAPSIGATELPFVTALSADGSVAVGVTGGLGSLEIDRFAFRWTHEAGLVELGALGGGPFAGSIALGVSADGATIYGASMSDIGYEAFRWTSAEGMHGLGRASWVVGVSADGDTIATWTPGIYGSTCECNAEVWNVDSAWTELPLGFLALGLSGDGRIVLGSRFDTPSIWSAIDGERALPAPTGWEELGWGLDGRATFASTTGVVVAGWHMHGPFLWNPVQGTRHLGDVLVGEHAVDIGECRFEETMGLSADGFRVLVWGGCGPIGTPTFHLVDVSPACMDGIDTDDDGLVDLADDGCVNRFDMDERPDVGCGVGPELALVLPLVLALRALRRPRRG